MYFSTITHTIIIKLLFQYVISIINLFRNFLFSKIIPSIGGLPKQKTRKFLADGQEVSEDDPKIDDENVAQYNAMLYPLKKMPSSDIIEISDCEF